MNPQNKTISLGEGLHHLYKPETSKHFFTESDELDFSDMEEPFESFSHFEEIK